MTQCEPYTTFKGVSNISQDFLLNILESNFKHYFDWAFLTIGAWFDSSVDEYNFYSSSNQHSTLVLVDDQSYDAGQVWQGIRKDWVWETDVEFNSTSPISISGIFIDGVFNEYNDSCGYTINYPEGRIIFDTAQSTSSTIQLNYSYRNIQTYRSNDNLWFNTIQYQTFNTANPDITRSEDGSWSISGNQRIQLPAIVIESVPRSRSRPFELGNDNLLIEQDISFYVLAENKNDRNKLLDILRLQQDATIWLYNTNSLAKDDNYPLKHNGDLKTNALMYPDIVNQYKWRKCWIKNVSLFELDSINHNFHQGLARATIEIIST